MYCSRVQCTSIYCNIVQCSSIYCSRIQCTSIYCNIVQSSSIYCSRIQFTSIYCNIVQCSSIYCNIVQFTSLYYSIEHCSAIYFSIVFQCTRPVHTVAGTILELDCTVILPIMPYNGAQYRLILVGKVIKKKYTSRRDTSSKIAQAFEPMLQSLSPLEIKMF